MSSNLDIAVEIKEQIAKFSKEINVDSSGIVMSVGDGIARVYGLRKAFLGEVVSFENHAKGICFSLEKDSVGVIVLDDYSGINTGSKVTGSGKPFTVKSGKEVLGRVLDGLGNVIDGKSEINSSHDMLVENQAPGIIARKSVCEPFQTGIKVIDALVPIGRGQRELLIGDRQTGKSTIIIDSILAQKEINQKAQSDKDKMFCIYVAIGQKRSSIAKMVRLLEERGAMEYTCVVAATASDSASAQYLAPYVGCAIGEYFRDNGMHAAIFYDDLSKQAVAYRQLSLLMRRPPGREAYPGDVFYLHSRLLERAARVNEEHGGGSLTAIPVIETQANDISAYIPTNVISITDGQIFLETDLFKSGVKPAVNIGASVSRVGGAAQTKAMKAAAGSIKLELAQYAEVAKFSQFSSDLDASTMALLDRGRKWTELLKQGSHAPQSVIDQVVVMYALANGYLKEVAVNKVSDYEAKLIRHINVDMSDLVASIKSNGYVLSDDHKTKLNQVISKFTDKYLSVEG